MQVALAAGAPHAAFVLGMNQSERQKAKEAAAKEAVAYRKALAKRLVDARHAAKKTQMELAHDAGISLASLQGYESGKREPQFVTAFLLATALGLTTQELLFGLAPRQKG